MLSNLVLAASSILAASASMVASRCEAVATYNGSQEPSWTVICINPCAQGCWTPPPVDLGGGVSADTCACVGGYPSPDDCCRLWMTYIGGSQVAPTGLGECREQDPVCQAGDYCGGYWIDEETYGAKCFWN